MKEKRASLADRISEMETRYEKVSQTMSELNMAIEKYNTITKELAILRDYMESGQWQKDFEADEEGGVPHELKREVLSEDGLYDLLTEADRIIEFAKESFN